MNVSLKFGARYGLIGTPSQVSAAVAEITARNIAQGIPTASYLRAEDERNHDVVVITGQPDVEEHASVMRLREAYLAALETQPRDQEALDESEARLKEAWKQYGPKLDECLYQRGPILSVRPEYPLAAPTALAELEQGIFDPLTGQHQ